MAVALKRPKDYHTAIKFYDIFLCGFRNNDDNIIV